jgi:glutaredoxin 3
LFWVQRPAGAPPAFYFEPGANWYSFHGGIGRQANMQIRLFIKPYCGWCHQAQRWLDERGLKYQTLDVTSDRQAYAEMVSLSGQTLAPVIEVDGRILADFGPEELARFWDKNSTADERG